MSDRTALLGPITSALLVLSAITGHFVVSDRVGTHRPVVANRGGIALPGGQNVDARLWQDPLAAVLAAKSDRSADQALKHLTNRIREHVGTPPQKPPAADVPPAVVAQQSLTILPVFIPGGDYAEDSEVRRRYRVAVVSALMTADFVPSSTEHIGSFSFQPVLAAGLEAKPMPIPYEWYEHSRFVERTGDTPAAVLVLWLPERALGSDPLLGGEHVVCEPLTDLVVGTTAKARKSEVEHLKQRIRFRVIGPSNSNTLAAMVASLVGRRQARAAAADPEAGRPIAENEVQKAVELRVGKAPKSSKRWAAAKNRLSKSKNNGRAILKQALDATDLHRRRLQMQQPVTVDPVGNVAEQADAFLVNYLETKQGNAPEGAGGKAAIRDQIVAALTPKARILSPRATVPDRHLLTWARADAKLKPPAKTLQELFASDTNPHVFSRTNCTDDELAAAVLDELVLRGVDPTKDRIALILERDTLYGRTLEQTFEAAIEARRRGGDTSATDLLAQGVADTVNVEVFSYLRGIDGITPATSASTPRSAAERDTPGQDVEGLVRSLLDSTAGLPANHAFGPNQFDRVLQLADTIAERGAKDAFHAIGIVGSDIYDKLAILQALEPRFPDHVFFTTDLDARLVPSELTPFTQNLVVVSGFGHELHPSIQRDAGAFRDSYQSAIFLATLAGVGDQPQSALGPITPRVFEIGRTRPIEFATTIARSPLHPPIESFAVHPREIVLGSSFVLLALVLAYLMSIRIRRELRRLTTETVTTRPHLFVLGLLVTVVLFALVLSAATDFLFTRQGEPFYWTQSVSMWPTEFVRIGACAAAVVMLWLGLVRIRHSDTGIGDRFFCSKDDPTPTWPRTPWSLWQACALRRCDQLESPSPAESWTLYRELGQAWPRFVRIAPFLLLAFAISAAALLLQPAPRPPYRGDTAYWLDFAVGSYSVVLTVFLALGVADSARLSNALVRMLGRAAGDWPKGKAAEQLAAEHGLEGEDLADHLRIDIVCQRTTAVGRLFWYPFAVMALMTFGQYSTFDAWHWPLPFLALMFGLAVAVFVSGILLLRATRRSREAALERMHRRIARLSTKGEPKATLGKHERLLTASKEIDTGAFSGLRSPMVDAVLLPSGGLAVLSLLELMAVVMAN
ncbi:MAG: hypothetical protein NXI31_19270 [bacterium]|nr:hypothetical protein [bacterium]